MNQSRPAAQESGPVRIRVLCDRKYHVISLDARGRLVLHGHTPSERRRAKAFAALGGQTPRCLAVLHAWQRCVQCRTPGDLLEALRDLPKDLQPAASAANEDHKNHAMRAEQGTDPLDTPLVQRPAVLTNWLTRLLNTQFPGLSCVVTGSPGNDDYDLTVRAGNYVLHRTELDQRWHEAVLKAGLAVIDGGLTLKVEEVAGGLRLTQLQTVEEADGTEVTDTWVRYSRRPDGGVERVRG